MLGGAPGTLGFRTGARGWFRPLRGGRGHAPRHGRSCRPAAEARLLALGVRRGCAPSPRWAASRRTRFGWGIFLRAPGGERVISAAGALQRRRPAGTRGRNYVAEGPFEADERALIPSFVPAWGFHPRPDATYFSDAVAALECGATGAARQLGAERLSLGQRAPGPPSAEVDAVLRLRVLAGPRPADVLRRLTTVAGGPSRGRRARRSSGPGISPAMTSGRSSPACSARTPLSVAQDYTAYLPWRRPDRREVAERERVRASTSAASR